MKVTATTLPFSADSATGAAGLIGQLEVGHRRADRHQHRRRRRVLQAGVDRRGGDHLDAIDPRASALHRKAEPHAVAGVSVAARADPFRSNGIAIASMKPGKASCEIVTVAPGLIDAKDEAGRGVMRGAGRERDGYIDHEDTKSTKTHEEDSLYKRFLRASSCSSCLRGRGSTVSLRGLLLSSPPR